MLPRMGLFILLKILNGTIMKTSKTNLVMKSAWRIFRALPHKTFSWALAQAWEIQKELEFEAAQPAPVKITLIRNILMRLSSIRKSFSQEHFHVLNSQYGKKIMRRPEDDETRQMIAEGDLFIGDIMNTRRRLIASARFNKHPKPIEKRFRNRIVKPELCERVNVDEFLKSIAA